MPSSDLLGKRWNEPSLQQHFREQYEDARRRAFANESTAPYPPPNPDLPLVAYSNAWWRSWFTDERAVAESLAAFDGRVVFHLGEIDSQAPARRQMQQYAAFAPSGSARLQMHRNRGHAFRSGHPVCGPMDVEAIDLIVKDVAAIV